jgi:hypothetical protein
MERRFHNRTRLNDHKFVEHAIFVGNAQFAQRIGIQHKVVSNLEIADKSANDFFDLSGHLL